MNPTPSEVLVRNTAWNLLGNCAPLLVAVFAIPPLIRGLGTDRFGVLALSWVVVGYFSLFDMGLGRAMTKLVAGKVGAGAEDEVPPLFWTSFWLMLLLGVAGAAVAVMASPLLIRRILHVPAPIQQETLLAFYVLSAGIPIVISTTGLRGLLEARQCFGLATAVRIPLGVLTYGGPLAVLPFSKSLVLISAVLVLGRALAWLVHLMFCFKVQPELRRIQGIDGHAVKPLLRFGSWMTVSNVVSPLMCNLDRFFVGALISVGAVAYYATPYELVTKLLIVPTAIVGVLFPAFSASFAQNSIRAGAMLRASVKYTCLVLFPIVLVVIAFAPEGLRLWLGTEFAERSSRALQWLAVGVFLNALALIPFAAVQGAGRPDWTGKLHLLELPFYLVMVWCLIGKFGIEGAAMAWTARVAVDTAVLFAMAQRIMPAGSVRLKQMAGAAIAFLAVLGAAFLMADVRFKAGFLFFSLAGSSLLGWFAVLDPAERLLVRGGLRKSSTAV